MALNANTYSGKEFKVYVAADDVSSNAGTFNDQQNNFIRLDVEGITLPTFSPQQEFEMRSGSGRVAEFGQIFSSSKRVITEFSLSGRLTTSDLPVFIENVLSFGGVAGSNRTTVKIPSGFSTSTTNNALTTKTHVGTDVTAIAAETDYQHTLSVAFLSPTGTDGYKFSGCVITSLSIDGDMDSAAGRVNFFLHFKPHFNQLKVI